MDSQSQYERARGGSIVVVKLGGSVIKNGEMSRTLGYIVRARVPVVLVCGGGGFAAEIRRVQPVLGISDKAAHRMAILAMHQNALALTDLHPELKPVEAISDLHLALRRGRVPVWLPLKMCDRDRSIARDWSITSDGLAARLAERLEEKEVLLIKSRCAPSEATAQELVLAGVVDSAFAEIVDRAGLAWQIFGPGQEREFAARLLVSRQHATQVSKAYDHCAHYRSGVRQRRAIGRR